MAGVASGKLISAGPWPQGINNLALEGEMPKDQFGKTTVAVREADNIDFTKTGRPRRRRGYERRYEGALSHSLWSHKFIDFGLFVDDGQLMAFAADEAVVDLGFEVGNQPLSYELINSEVFFSNAFVSGRVSVDQVVTPWGPEQPDGQPTVAAVAGYGLTKGTYQVAVTFVDAQGRESGSTLAAQLEVEDEGGIALSHIPQPNDLAATPYVLVYVTDPNDQVPRLYATLPAGVTVLTVAQAAQGRSLQTQFLTTMPAGQIVRLFNGRQFVATGNLLRWSPALRYGLTNRSKHVMHFNKAIDLVEPGARGGMYVAFGDLTYWFGGADPEAWTQDVAMASGVVPGSVTYVPGTSIGLNSPEDVPVWLSRSGNWCIGGDNGKITVLKAGEAVVDDATRGATLFREQQGIQQLVTALKGPRSQGLAVTDKAVAHVIHTS